MKNKLTCGIGIITYQRQKSLVECLHHIAKQSLIPQEIFIVDASTDNLETEKLLKKEFSNLIQSVSFTFRPTNNRGTTVQRNIILKELKSDIVFFLDDDCMIEPSYIQKIMEVYEADTDRVVGGIEGLATDKYALEDKSPSDHNSQNPLKFSPRELIRNFIHYLRIHWTGPFFPKALTQPKHPVPKNLMIFSVTPISSLYGCVMSFRTSIAKKYLFNEKMKLYAFMEDTEFSMRIGKQFTLLRCQNAKACHLRSLSGRLDPSLIQYVMLINVAYIGRRVFDWTSELNNHIEGYAKRVLQFEYILGFFKKKGFSQYQGAKAGFEETVNILNAPCEALDITYERAMDRGVKQKDF